MHRWMGKSWTAIALIVLLLSLLAAGCSRGGKDSAAKGGTSSSASASERLSAGFIASNQNAASETSKSSSSLKEASGSLSDSTASDGASLRQALLELTVDQQDNGLSLQTAFYPEAALPQEPVSYSVQLKGAQGSFVLRAEAKAYSEELLHSIRAEGGRLSIRPAESADSSLRYTWTLTDAVYPVKLTFGDLPAITLTYSPPLGVSAAGRLVLMDGRGTGVLPLYPGDKEAVLTFSEPIRMESATVEGPAEWSDARTLRIAADARAEETTVRLSGIRGTEGHGLLGTDELTLRLLRAPEAAWYRYGSSRPVTWSKLDGHYEYVSFSPDASRYIGFLRVGESQGDSLGAEYAMVLEAKGQDARLLKPYTFLNLPDQPPAVWLDNRYVLLPGAQGLWRYDTEEGIGSGTTGFVPRLWVEADGNGPFAYAYDRAQDRLYGSTVRFESAPDDSRYPVDLRTFGSQGTRLVEERKEFTLTYEQEKYHAMPVVPLFGGDLTYWRGSKEGTPVSWAASGGKTTELPWSKGITADAEGLYLQAMTLDSDRITGTGTYRYAQAEGQRKGGDSLTQRDLPAPPTANGVQLYWPQAFGTQLLARSFDAAHPEYLRFDKKSWSWVPFSPAKQGVWVPVQTDSELYRLPLASASR